MYLLDESIASRLLKAKAGRAEEASSKHGWESEEASPAWELSLAGPQTDAAITGPTGSQASRLWSTTLPLSGGRKQVVGSETSRPP